MKLHKQAVKYGVLVSAPFVAGLSHAAIDTTDVIAAITAAGVAVALVGSAVLVLHSGIKVYKWIRAAM